MSDHPLSRPLQFSAGIVLVVTVLATMAIALNRGQLPEYVVSAIIPGALCLAAGVGITAIILGLMGLLEQDRPDQATRKLLTEIRDQLAHPQLPPADASASPTLPSGIAVSPDNPRIVQLLDEIRDISLMDEQQKRDRYARLLAARRQAASATIETMVAAGNWKQAQAALQQAGILFGESPELKSLAERLNSAMMAAEQSAFLDLQSKVRDFQATENWDQAIAGSEAFVRQFPDSAPGLEFHANLIQSRDTHIDALANSLYEEIRINIEQRSWRRALSAAQRLLAKCPNHWRAQKIQLQIDDIRQNADTEQRNAMESRIHELVKAGRIQDAITVAEDLIKAYPLSPQAEIASQLVLKLREKLETKDTQPV